ncbi:MAG: hypothetical protein L0H73_09985 [Nitrococcus sp.]|nr:hypothetical protein [Nitrococcus sp.]
MATENISPTASHDTTDRFAKAAHEAVDRVATQGARAEERLRTTGDRYGDQSREAIDTLTAYIHDHPYAALGWAVAGGFVIGRLLGRR